MSAFDPKLTCQLKAPVFAVGDHWQAIGLAAHDLDDGAVLTAPKSS
jgi:hypothetical protein